VSSERPPWAALATLGVAALALRIAASFLVPDPAYLDAAYYEVVARSLAAGDGFNVPVVWSFLETGGVLPPEPMLPVPSNRHWMPLTAIVSAGSMSLFGATRFAAELPHAVLGAALVPTTGWIGWWLWGSRRVALFAGVLALFAGPMLVYVPMVDSFALFGVTGTVALAASIRATAARSSGGWLVVAGVAAGLATLTRIDGVLLGVAPAIAWLARRGTGPWRVDGPSISAWWAVAGVTAGALVLAPWLARQLVEFGSALPSAGGRMVWITSYNDQFSITGSPTLAAYLERGPAVIVGTRLDTFVQLLGRTTVVLGGAFIAPFLFGLWRERRRPGLAPFIVYWVVLFAVMVLVFTLHAPFGAWYHSAWAWLPFAIPLAVANGLPLLDAIGRRVPMLRRPRNVRFLAGTTLAGAVVLSLVGSAALAAGWRRDSAKVASAAAYLSTHAGSSDVVMYVDPPSLNLLTGNPAVPPPFEPPSVVGDVARAYDVRWLVIERAPGASRDVLDLWDGAAWLDDLPAYEDGDIRIYAVER
jgi:4-amino-4-deoxy-L-arabinose transferase-like glycosyltransferase